MSMKFFCPEFPSSHGLKVYGESDIMAMIDENKEMYVKHCSNSSSVLQYMLQFSTFIQDFQDHKNYEENYRENHGERSLKVLSELRTVGFNKVSDISQDLNKVEFSHRDERGKVHKLEILIPPDYPHGGLLSAISDIPGNIEVDDTTSFEDIYYSWVENIRLFSPVLSVLAELDMSCWVIDPDPPTTAHLYRRIALAPSLSIQIEIDPANPSDLPQITCFGPDSKVRPLRSKLLCNADDWDQEDPIIHNLEKILDVEFPSRISVNREDLKVDCSICYSYNLEGKTPTIICNNERCSTCFHEDCLYEWLKSLTDTRQTLDTLFGTCPYCQKPIRVHINIR